MAWNTPGSGGPDDEVARKREEKRPAWRPNGGGGGWKLLVDLALADAARLASQADGAPLRPLLPAVSEETTL